MLATRHPDGSLFKFTSDNEEYDLELISTFDKVDELKHSLIYEYGFVPSGAILKLINGGKK